MQDPLAEDILGGTIKDGEVVDVGVADGQIKLKARKSKAKAA